MSRDPRKFQKVQPVYAMPVAEAIEILKKKDFLKAPEWLEEGHYQRRIWVDTNILCIDRGDETAFGHDGYWLIWDEIGEYFYTVAPHVFRSDYQCLTCNGRGQVPTHCTYSGCGDSTDDHYCNLGYENCKVCTGERRA